MRLAEMVASSSFLIIGAAGSIGQSVSKEIFKRNPKLLHCVDISENNLVELVRDLRSSYGYIKGEFRTYALDAGSLEFENLFHSVEGYDYILNLSALKHVRSERDPFTIMRMIDVNIFNSIKVAELSLKYNAKKYFCVSTDKAANPVNMMGGSKRIMEIFLNNISETLNVSMARFANVAFSDGSLLFGFQNRIQKKQPIAAPNDIKRYFLSHQEAGELCLMSCLLGENRDLFFPKLSEQLNLTTFSEIAERYLYSLGFAPYICNSEEQARSGIDNLIKEKKWPCFFSASDTTGEKDIEEFYTNDEEIDLIKFNDIGIVKNKMQVDQNILTDFQKSYAEIRKSKSISKEDFLNLYKICLPSFIHEEKQKFLDDKM
jgi:FlaA1/EpsC-like NDP-sugar epimerase